MSEQYNKVVAAIKESKGQPTDEFRNFMQKTAKIGEDATALRPGMGMDAFAHLVAGTMNCLPQVPSPTVPGLSTVVMDDKMMSSLIYSAMMFGIGLAINEEIR